MTISRAQMYRQLYQNGGNTLPIYPRIEAIETSLGGAEERIGDPALEQSSGFSPLSNIYSSQIPKDPLGMPGYTYPTSPVELNGTPRPGPLENLGPINVDPNLIYDKPRPGPLGNLGPINVDPNLIYDKPRLDMTVGDPRLGFPMIPGNPLQEIMRGGAANGGRMGYQVGGMSGMGIESLSPMQPAMQPAMQSAMYTPLENTYYSGMPMMMAGGGIANLVDREKYGIGSKLKKFVRNIIPNEIAEIAVKAAPFVAPFNPLLAGAMAGIGGFDQTGRIGSSLKSAALTYGAGQIARGIGGAGFQEGFNPFAGADFSGGFTSGLGSLFTSPMGNLPFGSFSTPTSAPINLTPTQVDFTGIDDYGQLGYKPGYTVSGGGPTAVGNPRDVYDPTIDYSGAGTRYEGFTSDDLLKTAPSPAPIKEQGYVDLIKKAGSLENIPLSERFGAVKDLGSKALQDIFYKPIRNKDTGAIMGYDLDKNAVFGVVVGASSYAEALGLLGDAGVPDPEKVLTEEEYQRLKIDPEKAKYKDTLKDEAFGIRKAKGGRIGYGLGDLVRGSGMATAIPGGNVSESRGLGGMIQRLIQQNPQMFKAQMSASRRDFIDNDNNGIDDREEAAGGGLMDGGVLSIKLTPAQAMAMGGRIGYQMGGFTDYLSNPLYQSFLQSSFYQPGPSAQVITPITLPSGQTLNLPNAGVADQFKQYLSSFTPTPGLTAPIVETPISVAEQVQKFAKQGTPAVNEEFIINRRRQAEQDAAARVTPKKAKGGKINYPMGSEIPVRQNQGGITELDLRAKGGYIPVGIKEKADDVPAMLSRNEFVFTADAVRGAGGGNINKGAQKMYKLMKSLEKKVKKMKKVT